MKKQKKVCIDCDKRNQKDLPTSATTNFFIGETQRKRAEPVHEEGPGPNNYAKTRQHKYDYKKARQNCHSFPL